FGICCTHVRRGDDLQLTATGGKGFQLFPKNTDAGPLDEGDQPVDLVGGEDFTLQLRLERQAGIAAGEELALGKAGQRENVLDVLFEVGSNRILQLVERRQDFSLAIQKVLFQKAI